MIRIRQILPVFLLIFTLLNSCNAVFAQMEFVENKGQWHREIKYKGLFNGGIFFLEEKGFSVLLHNSSDLRAMNEQMHHPSDAKVNNTGILHSFFYRVSFLGASIGVRQVPEKMAASYNNYFIGNDKSAWAEGCKLYQAVTYKDVYPNIDVRYYTEGDKLKYDFIIRPGGNISQIALQYDGPLELAVKNKELVIKTSIGDVIELPPYSYQVSPSSGKREQVNCKYIVRNNVVTFQAKNYDPSQTLVIDPRIIFSSFTGSRVDNWGYTATPGPDGSFFAGGIAFAGDVANGYPYSPGAFQTTFGGGTDENLGIHGYDIAIFKFSANGTQKLYATYLGGRGNEQPHSMICDAQGNLVLAGRSSSVNYPLTVPRIGPGGENDIIITKFNATGTALLGSVMIGGTKDDGVNIRSKYMSPAGTESLRRNYGDDARSEVIFDASGNIILSSCSRSVDFPTNGPSLNSSGGFGGGDQDGVILKFNPNLSVYQYGSYFGGSGIDACFVASFNPLTGNLYVGGGTTSNDLPGTATGVLYPSFRGGEIDGFVTELNITSATLLRTTYMGTTGIDIVYGLKFDRKGFPYAMGTTTGDWPVQAVPGVPLFQVANSSQFIVKLKPDLSAFVYSTRFGSGTRLPNLSPIGFMVDRCENVYVSGWGGGINSGQTYIQGNTNGLPEVDPLNGIPAADGKDFYFFVLKKDAERQLFGSHFGQNGGFGDHVDGGTSRFDDNGVIYQAICGNCGGGAAFPITPGVVGPINASNGHCNEIALKIEMDFSGVAANIKAAINGVANDTLGCIPFEVFFKDTLRKGKKYYWDFGNGLKDTTLAPEFSTSTVYNTIGTFIVSVIAEDSSTCNIRDTAYIKIRAGDNLATINFTALKEPPCTSLTYSFQNLSVPTRGNFGPQSFVWDFGDGSPTFTGFTPPLHTFPAIGDYLVTLTLVDTTFCNAPQTDTLRLHVDPLIKALFRTPSEGCAPYLAQFTNLSGTSDVTWQFSDGTSTNVENPVKPYNVPGTYSVRLIARDPNTCNKIDTSAWFTIVVSPKPVARFTWNPDPPLRNTPTRFTNLSTGATRYLWNFGDGETSTEVNPTHQYNATGDYNVELIAYNPQNCTDTFPLVVRALIDPLLDVPSAFTPGRFGVNGIVTVAGFGIAKMDWKIYNRWGQLVFQTNNRKEGWNGTFKGKLQAMDVYVYTLDVEFTDGKKLRKKGDITLLR